MNQTPYVQAATEKAHRRAATRAQRAYAKVDRTIQARVSQYSQYTRDFVGQMRDKKRYSMILPDTL